jgi:hypothetical protein
MVINPDVLFLHIPKTSGTSCTDYLCQTLKGPVFPVLAALSDDIGAFPGKRHTGLQPRNAGRDNGRSG